jgi:hypothetical protein
MSRYRPKMPHEWHVDKKTWLNTFDILNVMQQYEKKYTDFAFLGVFPLDFASRSAHSNSCITKMCDFQLEQLIDTKKKFGMVVNMDKSTGRGSHWVAFYFCVGSKKGTNGVCYYDSTGQFPPKEIQNFIVNVKGQIENCSKIKNKESFKYKFNNIQHQRKNSECGVFSMNFIRLCLENPEMNFRSIKQLMGSDDDMNKLRDYFYTKLV